MSHRAILLGRVGGFMGGSWALLGVFVRFFRVFFRILRVLLRLLSLLVCFCACWGAPGSILEGSGTLPGGFWRPQGFIFRGF